MKTLLLITVCCFVWFGCDSQSEQTIVHTGSGIGDITGYATLYDQYGEPFSDHSGVKVKLEGTSFEATSDQQGSWTLQDVPQGTYTISLEKEGFGTMKDYSLQHTGGGTYHWKTILLWQKPLVDLAELVLRQFDSIQGYRYIPTKDSLGRPYYKTVYGMVYATRMTAVSSQPFTQYFHAQFFFSKQSSIDPANPGSYNLSLTNNFPQGEYYINLYYDSLINRGYVPGEKVYVTSALLPVSATYYYDPVKRTYIYTAWSKQSETKSFIVP